MTRRTYLSIAAAAALALALLWRRRALGGIRRMGRAARPPAGMPASFPDAELIQACVRCGLCLPYCPTYAVLGLEADSPRGRIYQMKLVAEGVVDPSDPDFHLHMFRCLDCRACETACPSGVQYGRLIEAARSLIPPESALEGAARGMILGVVIDSRPLLEAAGVAVRLYQRSGLRSLVERSNLLAVAPGLRRLESMLPPLEGPLLVGQLPTFVAAKGERRCRVAFLSGCVASQLFPRTNRSTIAVLAANGCDVITPSEQGCCGALQNHSGDRERARAMARHNVDVFERVDPDYIVTNAAGCGSMMKEYSHLLRDDPAYAGRAETFSARVRDVTELLFQLGLRPPTHPVRRRVTYQDACHLGHGQKVRAAPRELLRAIPGLELVEMRQSDWCCGSAGIYNIVQPELSERVLALKMPNLAAAGAEMVVASNPGCLIQLQHGLRERGLSVDAAHPIDLLAEAYGLTQK